MDIQTTKQAAPTTKIPKNKKKFKDISVTTTTLILICIIGLIYLGIISFLYFGTLPVDKTDDSIVSVVIVQDTSVSSIQNLKDIAQTLKDEELIKNKLAFTVKAFFMGEYCKIQDKEYELSPNMSAEDIILMLSSTS